jgi:hypothetical protein
VVKLTIGEKQAHPTGSPARRRTKRVGGGDDPSQRGIRLPPVIPVRESDEHWIKYRFTPGTACHVISDPVQLEGKTQLEHTFYINVDNSSLKTEMKYSKQDARLLEAKFKYGNVLLGLAILHDAERNDDLGSNGDGASGRDHPRDDQEDESTTVQDTIRKVSSAVAPVLLPIIDQLSGLSEESLEEFSNAGEDA